MGRTFEIVVAAITVLVVLWLCLPLDRGRPGGCGNESCAVANLRTINTAEVTYLSMPSLGRGSYGTMTDLIDAKLLDDTFTGTKAGYNYAIMLDATRSNYTAEAMPASSKTGRYAYYSLPDAVVRYWTDASLAPTAAQVGKSVQ